MVRPSSFVAQIVFLTEEEPELYIQPEYYDISVNQSNEFYTHKGSETSSRSISSLASCVPIVGVVGLSLIGLCTLINAYSSMQSAVVVRSSTFVEKKPVAPHRCLILELRRPGRKVLWLRLERKPTSSHELMLGSGRTPSNDVVGVSREAC